MMIIMASSFTISVTAETNVGCRRHMEDYLAVRLDPLKEQAYIGVFDGHGGKEAAKYARERLWDIIQSQPKYKLSDVSSVKESLQEAFLALHEEMEPLRATWKRNETGDLSTAGTTASIVIFRRDHDHIFVANVGDSTAVLAVRNPLAGQQSQHSIKAVVLTKDHKPEDPEETKSIEDLGGSVMTSRKGVTRVVWKRPRKLRGGLFDSIPFLSVSRSLGDFWSFNPSTNRFAVSPKPDVHVHRINPKKQKFVVIASDGLWNVMTPDEVVRFIWDYEHDQDECHQPRDVVRAVINKALQRWERKRLSADNIAVLIAFLTEEVSSSAQTTSEGVEDATIAEDASPSTDTASSDVREESPALPSLLSPKHEVGIPAIMKVQRVHTSNSSPIGKHNHDIDLDVAPASKRSKTDSEIESGLAEVLADDDSGVCRGDDNLAQPVVVCGSPAPVCSPVPA